LNAGCMNGLAVGAPAASFGGLEDLEGHGADGDGSCWGAPPSTMEVAASSKLSSTTRLFKRSLSWRSCSFSVRSRWASSCTCDSTSHSCATCAPTELARLSSSVCLRSTSAAGRLSWSGFRIASRCGGRDATLGSWSLDRMWCRSWKGARSAGDCGRRGPPPPPSNDGDLRGDHSRVAGAAPLWASCGEMDLCADRGRGEVRRAGAGWGLGWGRDEPSWCCSCSCRPRWDGLSGREEGCRAGGPQVGS